MRWLPRTEPRARRPSLWGLFPWIMGTNARPHRLGQHFGIAGAQSLGRDHFDAAAPAEQVPAHFIKAAGREADGQAAVGPLGQLLRGVEAIVSRLGGGLGGKAPFDLMRLILPCPE